jgi:hypothetical protein
VDAVVEHMTAMLHGLDRLEQHGFAFPDRRITVLATEQYSALGDRIVSMLGQPATRAVLEHPYYNKGLRFQISARSNEGPEIPLVDGGAFDWLAAHVQPKGRVRGERPRIATRAADVPTRRGPGNAIV